MYKFFILLIINIIFFSGGSFGSETKSVLSLTAISSSKAVLQWSVTGDSPCAFYYGTNPWDLENKISISDDKNEHQVILTKLKSNSRYFCQVYYFDASSKTTKKIPPTPLQIKTLQRDSDRNGISIIFSEILTQSDSNVLVKLILSEPCIADIKYGVEKRNLKNLKKSVFFNTTHYIFLDDIDDIKKTFFSVTVENILGQTSKFREPKNLNISENFNPNEIPEEYKNIFIKSGKIDDAQKERGVRSRTQRSRTRTRTKN
ncbi:MAG TPA: hypothetical protein PKY81_16070 [bacterium]|nr:hypothetical protein [bacterium]HPN32469.1 hypothetical protein [bacterium]